MTCERVSGINCSERSLNKPGGLTVDIRFALLLISAYSPGSSQKHSRKNQLKPVNFLIWKKNNDDDHSGALEDPATSVTFVGSFAVVDLFSRPYSLLPFPYLPLVSAQPVSTLNTAQLLDQTEVNLSDCCYISMKFLLQINEIFASAHLSKPQFL